MRYKKITVEVVVPADEAEAVVAELNSSLDQLDEKYTLSVAKSRLLLSSIGEHGSDRLLPTQLPLAIRPWALSGLPERA